MLDTKNNPRLLPPMSKIFHSPPPSVGVTSSNTNFYESNESVFGRILEGTLEARIYHESENLLAFQDIHPYAPLHALIIPKQHVGDVFDLQSSRRHSQYGASNDDGSEYYGGVTLVEDMTSMAHDILREVLDPSVVDSKDYSLVFHVPPFHSVDHLHMHVLAPKSQMGLLGNLKYREESRWCVTAKTVTENLQRGQAAVPFRKWTKGHLGVTVLGTVGLFVGLGVWAAR